MVFTCFYLSVVGAVCYFMQPKMYPSCCDAGLSYYSTSVGKPKYKVNGNWSKRLGISYIVEF